MFKKPYEITLNRVWDKVKISENGSSVLLTVNSDPMRMVAAILQAQKLLQTIDEETTEEKKAEIALFFAEAIFGKDQAKDLMDFYSGDAACVINVCGRYFADRLSGLIDKAQRKAGLK